MDSIKDIAICLWGNKEVSKIDKDNLNNIFFEIFFSHPNIFECYETNIYKALWKVNQKKRQIEIVNLKLFEIVIYINNDFVNQINELDLDSKNIKNGLYVRHIEYVKDNHVNKVYPWLLYGQSLIGDYMANFIWNKHNEIDTFVDFYQHLKSYKIKLFKSQK